MKTVCIITGGGSGMGFEVAKLLGKTHDVTILVGRREALLQNAVSSLQEAGIQAKAFSADTRNAQSIKNLAMYASELGQLKTIVHAAGVSPHLADAETIFTINALGTMNINEILGEELISGGAILNVASMAGYMMPANQTPISVYKTALNNKSAFQSAAMNIIQSTTESKQPGVAYTISKNFVRWYSARMALKYGKQGIRVVSISPGTFKTPMGEAEGQGADSFAKRGALGRVGEPREIAKMMAFIVSDDASYLTGADILYDGGTIAAIQALTEDRT